MGGESVGAAVAGAGGSALWRGLGAPTAVSLSSLAAGGCQDATGLRTAPRAAQGQCLLSWRGHHPRPARAGEWGFPLPAHQRCGGLLHPHTVGPCCCPPPGLPPSASEPSASLASALLSTQWMFIELGPDYGQGTGSPEVPWHMVCSAHRPAGRGSPLGVHSAPHVVSSPVAVRLG